MLKKREQPYFSAKAALRLVEQTKWTARLREVTGFWLFSDLSQLNSSELFRRLANLSLAERISRFRSRSNEKTIVSSRLKPVISVLRPHTVTLTAPKAMFFKFKKHSMFLNRLSQLFMLNAAVERNPSLNRWWFKGILILVTILPTALIALWWVDLLLPVATDVSLLYWKGGFLQYFDYFYFIAGAFTKTLQSVALLTPGVLTPPFANFHIKTITAAFLFQDFELIVSYSEPFWFLFHLDPLTLVSYPLVLFFMLSVLIALLIISRKAFNILAFSRSDVWRFFISVSHDSSWLGRLHSAEALNQALGGRLMSLIGSSSQIFSGDLQNFYVLNQKTGVAQADRAYFEYFFAKTVGGVVGFTDLFPSTNVRRNTSFGWRGKLKAFLFFRKIRGLLLMKTRLMGRAFTAQAAVRRWHPSIKKLGKLRTLLTIPEFLTPQVYLDFSSLGFWRRFLDGFFNISRGGDASVLKLRHYFFKVVGEGRDPWNLFDRANSKVGERRRQASNLQRVNWYGRELNTFVLSKTLRTRFTIPALRKFNLKLHSQINDYSFWKPELNLSGQNKYSSKWDAFRAENLFDFNELRASRFEAFDSLDSEEEDDSNLDYVDEDLEVFFDDNLLHKDFELILFNHEFDDIVVKGRSDLLIADLAASPKLKAILTNESLIYGAGQEVDYVTKTNSTSYAGLHAAEYVFEGEYRREITDNVYNDLSDYLALNARVVAPYVFNIPEGRSFFYWDNAAVIDGSEISERARLGRFFYFYWLAASKFFTANYHKLWLPIYMFLFVSTFVWFLTLLWLVIAGVLTAQSWSYLLAGKLLGGSLFLFTSALLVFIFFGVWKLFLAERSKRYAILSFMLLECVVWLSLVALSVFLRKVKPNKVGLLLSFPIKRLELRPSPINVNVGNSFAVSYSDKLLRQFLVGRLSASSSFRVAGMSEFVFIKKLTGHSQRAKFGFKLPYNPPAFNVTSPRPIINLCASICRVPVIQVSTAAIIYGKVSSDGLAATRAAAALSLPTILLYDFDWRHTLKFNATAAPDLVRANFLSEVLFQVSTRRLQQHHSLWCTVADVSASATRSTRFPFIESVLRAHIGAPPAASHFLSDLLFDALGNDIMGGGRLDKLQEAALFVPPHSVGGVRSKRTGIADFSSRSARSRLRSTRFLEDDDSFRDRNYTNQNARENFLRLFLSRGLLRELYGERTKSISAAPAKWSYTSQIKWTVYATPLHGTNTVPKN